MLGMQRGQEGWDARGEGQNAGADRPQRRKALRKGLSPQLSRDPHPQVLRSAIMDVLTLQCDRHWRNVFVEVCWRGRLVVSVGGVCRGCFVGNPGVTSGSPH